LIHAFRQIAAIDDTFDSLLELEDHHVENLHPSVEGQWDWLALLCCNLARSGSIYKKQN
jgi:hypothetical protein